MSLLASASPWLLLHYVLSVNNMWILRPIVLLAVPIFVIGAGVRKSPTSLDVKVISDMKNQIQGSQDNCRIF